jgi:hypothetical protein
VFALMNRTEERMSRLALLGGAVVLFFALVGSAMAQRAAIHHGHAYVRGYCSHEAGNPFSPAGADGAPEAVGMTAPIRIACADHTVAPTRERFRAKWTPVRVKKTRQTKKLELPVLIQSERKRL